MTELKLLFSVVGGIISVGAFLYYHYSIVRGQTKPHIYTWLVFTLSLAIAFVIQFQNGAWYGAYITLAEFLWCFVVFLLSFKYWEKNITLLDTLCLVLALLSMWLYLALRLDVISTILIILIDLLAIIPTYRKVFWKPQEEAIVFYIISGAVFWFSILWLTQYNFTTYAYPLSVVVLNYLLVVLIAIRRYQLQN